VFSSLLLLNLDLSMDYSDFVIVGGGVAGFCLVEELDSLFDTPEFSLNHLKRSIVLIPGSSGFIKRVTNLKRVGQITQAFDVEEGHASYFDQSKRVRVVVDTCIEWKPYEKKLILKNSPPIRYTKLCIATGASPRHIFNNPNVIRIRDLETINELRQRLSKARRILIIGNGGIATELAFELKNVEIIWCIRHTSISATYFDVMAAKFFEPALMGGCKRKEKCSEAKMETCLNEANEEKITTDVESGCALGPQWLFLLNQSQKSESARRIHLIYDSELVGTHEQRPITGTDCNLPRCFLNEISDWNIWAELSNGELIGCDLVVEATGVIPNSTLWKRDCEQLKLADDGGILVNEYLETNVPDVYAAGDVCSADWAAKSVHWTQIRLWTQAKQMGTYCARSMLIPKENILQDICFEIFTHVTTFFAYKVVLLGDFSASKVQKPFKVHYRINEEVEYVKVITKDSRVQGAVLIGDTDLEETVENLILNQTDISQIEDDLLNPTIDLEDFFD